MVEAQQLIMSSAVIYDLKPKQICPKQVEYLT
jgi:hypothetical protein